MAEIIAPALSCLSLVVVAIIEAVASRDRRDVKAAQERTERRAKLRAEESKLSMELMSASCALSLVMAKKLTGQHTNGDVEEAMESATAAREDYTAFVRSVAAGQVTKN